MLRDIGLWESSVGVFILSMWRVLTIWTGDAVWRVESNVRGRLDYVGGRLSGFSEPARNTTVFWLTTTLSRISGQGISLSASQLSNDQSTYLPRLDSTSSQVVLRVRQCQHGCPSPASHFTRRAWQALQATRVRRGSGLGFSADSLMTTDDGYASSRAAKDDEISLMMTQVGEVEQHKGWSGDAKVKMPRVLAEPAYSSASWFVIYPLSNPLQ